MYRINLVYGLNSLTLGRLAPQHSVVETTEELWYQRPMWLAALMESHGKYVLWFPGPGLVVKAGYFLHILCMYCGVDSGLPTFVAVDVVFDVV